MQHIQDCQLSIPQMQENKTACAFTGHRKLEKDFSPRKLKKTIKALVEEGVNTFYAGMAMGFDLAAAEAVLSIKKKNPSVKLVACIPCYNQEKSFPSEEQKRYVKILQKADEQVVLADRYFPGCMQLRNRYMADRADVLVAYCHAETGGTAYTVKYFKKQKSHGDILFI
jgi:uncharacterized phage-like protein YoqJ